MEPLGRVLIADDEEVFLLATGDLLGREGYACDCVRDAESAVRMLREQEYDLLISDIEMPGNPELELIQRLPELAKGLPVILVTGYPSLRSAIGSVQLPVVAYLIKPVDLDELLAHVRTHTAQSRRYRVVRRARERLEAYSADLGRVEQLMRSTGEGVAAASLETFVGLHVRNVLDSLADIQGIVDAAAGDREAAKSAPAYDGSDPSRMLAALEKTIAVLEKTKTAFRSKDLGELRKELEGLVRESRK